MGAVEYGSLKKNTGEFPLSLWERIGNFIGASIA
jgi:hypothetical protein